MAIVTEMAAKTEPGGSAAQAPLENRSAGEHNYAHRRARRLALDRARRDVWKHMEGIILKLIEAGEEGNLPAAKFVFEFAGVGAEPEPQDKANEKTRARQEVSLAALEAMPLSELIFRRLALDSEPAAAAEPGK